MWFDPIGIFPWKPVAKFLLACICLSVITVGTVFIFKNADSRRAVRDKTTILCQDKVKALKLTPTEARIAYDLCKETDGRLP